MEILLIFSVSLFVGLTCFFVEQNDRIPIRLDRHRDALLAGITGTCTSLIASVILLSIHII